MPERRKTIKPDRLAGKATITSGLHLRGSEVWGMWDTTVGAKPRTSHYWSPGGGRCRKRKCSMIVLERTRKGYGQSGKHWNCFKGNVGETSERWDGAHELFQAHPYHLELNWTNKDQQLLTLLLDQQLLTLLWQTLILISSVQNGIYVLGKAHMCSTPSLRSFPNVAFETVPMFVWLMMALSHPLKKDCLELPLAVPLSSRQSMVWCPWLCAHR